MYRVKDRLKQKKIELHFTEQAVNLLAKLGYDPNFGARPVKRVIQQLVENEIAMKILRGDIKEEDTVIVDADTSPTASSTDLSPHGRLVIKRVVETGVLADPMVANN